ncbi:MAG: hypothetical protein R6W76_05330 [Caldilinea sp.]
MEPHASIANAYMSTAIPTDENTAGANALRWINARVDELIQAAGATVDLEERKAAYCELSDLIATELPRLNLYLFTEGYGASNRLSGYEVNMWGSLSWDIQNWQLQQTRSQPQIRKDAKDLQKCNSAFLVTVTFTSDRHLDGKRPSFLRDFVAAFHSSYGIST